MARYDYHCFPCGFRFEEERAIADRRALPMPECPRCRSLNTDLMFTPPPASNIRTPRAFRTNWSDVAPHDADGHAMSFTETVKDGRFDHYRPEVFEQAEKAEQAAEVRKTERLQKKHRQRFLDRAFGKVAVS